MRTCIPCLALLMALPLAGCGDETTDDLAAEPGFLHQALGLGVSVVSPNGLGTMTPTTPGLGPRRGRPTASAVAPVRGRPDR
ncbi:MAG: hypothetical protein R3F60_29060 [bacterium]